SGGSVHAPSGGGGLRMKLIVRSLLAVSLGVCTAAGHAIAASAAEAPPATSTETEARAPGLVGALTDALAKIQLRPDQERAIPAVLEELDQRGAEVGEADKALLLELAAEIDAGRIDRAALEPKVTALANAVGAAGTAMRRGLDKLHEVLDPSQRKELAD